MLLLLILATVLAKEDWRCFDWPTHRNFTKESHLYQECNKECGWISSCTPCRILKTDLYTCLDTQSNIDTYKYACGDLQKQFTCIMDQGIWFWFIMAGGFCLIVSFVGIVFHFLLKCWSK